MSNVSATWRLGADRGGQEVRNSTVISLRAGGLGCALHHAESTAGEAHLAKTTVTKTRLQRTGKRGRIPETITLFLFFCATCPATVAT